MAATYEGGSGPEGAAAAPTVTGGNHAGLSFPCEAEAEREDV